MSTFCRACGHEIERRSGRGRPPAFCGNCSDSGSRRAAYDRRRYELRPPRPRGAGRLTQPCSDCASPMQVTSTSAPTMTCLACRRARRLTRLTWTPETRPCERCSTEFTQRQPSQRYCSGACRERLRTPSPEKRARDKVAYGPAHRRLRAALLPSAYGSDCHLCGEVMREGQPLHLDHAEDRESYRGMAHAHCNLRDGSVRGNATKKLLREAA